MPIATAAKQDRFATCINWTFRRVVFRCITFFVNLLICGCMLNFPPFHTEINSLILAIGGLAGCLICGIIALIYLFGKNTLERIRSKQYRGCSFTRFEVTSDLVMAIALGCSSIILSQRGLCRALNSAAEEFCARYNAAVVFGVISMLCHSFLFLQGLKAAMYGPSPSSTTTSSSSSTAAGGSSRKHHSEAGVQDAQKSSTLSKSQSNSSLNGRPSKWAQPPVNQSDLEMQPKLPSRAGQVPRPSAWPPKE